jgi:acetolactate synthase I/II/III large subunit
MGIASYRIETSQDLRLLPIELICRRKGPTLLDVYIDKNEIAPIGARIKQLAKDKIAVAKTRPSPAPGSAAD